MNVKKDGIGRQALSSILFTLFYTIFPTCRARVRLSHATQKLPEKSCKKEQQKIADGDESSFLPQNRKKMFCKKILNREFPESFTNENKL